MRTGWTIRVAGLTLALLAMGHVCHAERSELTDDEARNNPAPVLARSADAWEVFDRELPRKGFRVLALGGRRPLAVPERLRFVSTDVRKLVADTAAAGGLKVVWLAGRTCAILQSGATDAELERLGRDMKSEDPALCHDAAWRARWIGDTRAIPLLMDVILANKDRYAKTTALESVGRLGWDVALAVDERAWPVAEESLANSGKDALKSMIAALGRVGGDRARVLLEKMLPDEKYDTLLYQVIVALGQAGREKSLPQLAKVLQRPDSRFGADDPTYGTRLRVAVALPRCASPRPCR